MKKIILMLWALAALVGCSKHEQPVDGNSNRAVELSGTIIDTGMTRGGDGVITGELPDKALPIDVFRVNETDYNSGEWGLKLAGNLAPTTGKIALSPIQFFETSGTSRFVGLYPTGGTYVKEDNTVTFTELDGAMDVMVSDFAEGSGATNLTKATLQFEHLLTKIKVELKAWGVDKDGNFDQDMTDEVINTWGKITKIEVLDKKTGAKITLPDPGNVANKPTIVATGTPGDLPLTDETGKEPAARLLTNSEVFFGYAMFLPVTDPTEKLTLKIYFEDGTSTNVTTATAQKYEVGKGYKITIVFEAQVASVETVELLGAFTQWYDGTGDQTEPKSGGTVTPQTATNAPDKMTNAYMVGQDQTLKFKVARAFNCDAQTGVFATTLRVDDQEYTGGFEAEVLWADVQNLFSAAPTVVGTGRNAVVTVKTNDDGVFGNAVVAIKKQNTSNIVWSYHIWVTNYVPDDSNTYPNTNLNPAVVFMDRNLGAIEVADLTAPARGLYYQWGRKDPFPAGDNPDGGGNIPKVVTDTNKGKITATIAAPATFLYSVAAAPASGDWLYAARNNDLWGHGVGNKKSVYDPCPSGWRVPANSGLPATADNSPWKGFDAPLGAWDTNGWKFADNAWYPAASYRDHLTGTIASTYMGVAAAYWSASPQDVDNDRVAFLYIVSGSPSLNSYYSRAAGMSVRCVKE